MSKIKGNGRIERGYPIGMAVLFGVGAFLVFPHLSVEAFSGFNRLADQSLRINTVLLGFFLSMFGLTASINTRAMVLIKSLGFYPMLVRYNKAAILAQFYSMLVILITSFYQFFEGKPGLDQLIFTVLVLVMSYSFLAGFRYAQIFLILMVNEDDMKGK